MIAKAPSLTKMLEGFKHGTLSMKSLIIILSISLMPFTALADSADSFEEKSSALWKELAYKESVLSAISVIEKTNEALGTINDNNNPEAAQLIVPLIVQGGLAATVGLTLFAEEIAAMNNKKYFTQIPLKHLKMGSILRNTGWGLVFLAGIGAYTYVTAEMFYIAVGDDHISHIKEQFTEDTANLRQILF